MSRTLGGKCCPGRKPGDTHTIGEGRDVQHVEQSSLRSSDLASSVDKLPNRS